MSCSVNGMPADEGRAGIMVIFALNETMDRHLLPDLPVYHRLPELTVRRKQLTGEKDPEEPISFSRLR